MGQRKPHLCQSEACAIQTCLKKNDYQESRCKDVIQQMINCCQEIRYQSYICDGFNPDLVKKVRPEQPTETKLKVVFILFPFFSPWQITLPKECPVEEFSLPESKKK